MSHCLVDDNFASARRKHHHMSFHVSGFERLICLVVRCQGSESLIGSNTYLLGVVQLIRAYHIFSHTAQLYVLQYD